MEGSIKEKIEIASAEERKEDILKGAIQSKSKSICKVSVKEGALSVVNAKTSTRIILSKIMLEELNNPTKVQASYNIEKKRLIIGEQLLNNENSYPVRRSGSKGVIYSKGLVDEITEAMELDFSNRSSITFQEAEYLKNDQYTVAIITIS